MEPRVNLAVNGTLMRGLELNPNLLQVGAEFLREALTEPTYRLWSIGDRHPAMQRVPEGGRAIALEVWAMPPEGFGRFVAGIPSPLGIGTLALADGTRVKGFLCETIATQGARDVTEFGGCEFARKERRAVEFDQSGLAL